VEAFQMAIYDQSIVDAIRSAVHDAQDLVRGEIALAKAEFRAEARQIAMAVAILAGAALMGVIALGFLFTTIAWAIAEGAGWPVWVGMGIVTLLTAAIAGALAMMGRKRLAGQRHMPLTVETIKENARWMRPRTS
jgi:protein-S-isoprenylcysteine O-methyltransferase Ste14